MKYRLTIGINHYYLEEEEKDFYLKAINGGQEFVQFKDGLVLSKKFIDLAPMSKIQEAEYVDKRIDEGKYECSFGNWHYKGNECNCDVMVPLHLAMEERKMLGNGD